MNLSYEGNGIKAGLRLETYVAVTPNSLQFGARIEAYAELSVANLRGYIGFDVLIEFQPFHFIADIYGGVVVRAFGFGFNVNLLLTLSGPKPFLGEGIVAIEFMGRHEFPIRFVIGEEDTAPALPPVDALEELLNAFGDPRNWSATVPTGASQLVTMRQLSSTEIGSRLLAHPLGELSVRQKVLPFGITLERFGAAVPSNPGPYDIQTIKVGTKAAVAPDPAFALRDAFARGQFVNLSEDEKISTPPFESFRCGHDRMGSEAVDYPKSAVQEANVGYDVTVIDDKDDPYSGRQEGASVISIEAFLLAAQFGAAKQTPMTATGSAKFAGPAKKVVVREPQYAVASTDDLTSSEAQTFATYTEASAARRASADEDTQVVEAFEVA
jgi:hypothetical protein